MSLAHAACYQDGAANGSGLTFAADDERAVGRRRCCGDGLGGLRDRAKLQRCEPLLERRHFGRHAAEGAALKLRLRPRGVALVGLRRAAGTGRRLCRVAIVGLGAARLQSQQGRPAGVAPAGAAGSGPTQAFTWACCCAEEPRVFRKVVSRAPPAAPHRTSKSSCAVLPLGACWPGKPRCAMAEALERKSEQARGTAAPLGGESVPRCQGQCARPRRRAMSAWGGGEGWHRLKRVSQTLQNHFKHFTARSMPC